jgi:predicted RNase H-like HicB family nuclease
VGIAHLTINDDYSITTMKLQIIVHQAEEGGYWVEVPSLAGCATQGDDFEELLQNFSEAIEGYSTL